MPKTQFPASVSLDTLDGYSGFILTGGGGSSVSGCGDLNADGITDLVIGEPGPYNSGKPGTSYVVFGKPEIGSSGKLELSSLNGNNGFVLNGVQNNDRSGWSVSGAGDVNADGIADLLIGAPAIGMIAPGNGCSYIVFGKQGIGSSGKLDLSSLSGSNGFVMIGGTKTDQTGYSVSSVGDINFDGIADVIIGAPEAYASVNEAAGLSYVVFGKSGIGSSGKMSLLNLDGSNGFALMGTAFADYSGISVSGVGDINDDGIDDLIIGTPYKGNSYVVFGKTNIGGTGYLPLSSLTGTNGFTAMAPLTDRPGGTAVKGIGDINGDKKGDFIIGSPSSSTGPGTSYVVFGNFSIGSSGTLDLSSLNGRNGFSITGVDDNEMSGTSVSDAGDINGDGITDLIIGAPGAMNNAGASYVVFGNFNIGNLGTFALSGLNGSNGFAIIGADMNDYIGRSVSGLGDINADGMADLIIGANNVGESYVIFGDKSGVELTLTNNKLMIAQGQAQTLTPSFLSVTNQLAPDKDPSLIFTVSSVQQGYFALFNKTTVAINQFSQQQVSSGQVAFVHDNGLFPPAYNLTIGYRLARTSPQPASIGFLSLGNNQLEILQGQTIILTSYRLSAASTIPGDSDPNLIFTLSEVQNGHCEFVGKPGIPITSFTQGQIQNNNVQFVSAVRGAGVPSYLVSVSDGQLTSKARASAVSYLGITNNELKVSQEQTVVLDSCNLSAVSTIPGDISPNLIFTASKVVNGYFSFVNNPTTPITSFTQGQILNGNVQFVSTGDKLPSYYVSVSDGQVTTWNQPGAVIFNAAPIITQNSLTIKQGGTQILTSNDLSAIDLETAAGDLIFTASAVAHGHFEDVGNPGTFITQFAQQKITGGSLKFVTDGSATKPGYNISVTDEILTSKSSAAQITFSPPDTVDNTMRNAMIGAAAGVGGIGLGLFALNLYRKRQTSMEIQARLGSEVEKSSLRDPLTRA